MEPVLRVNGAGADPLTGTVRLDWKKSIWNTGMLVGTVAALFTATLQAVLLFLVLTYVTLLVGHSVGMHRMMIHRSFKAKSWLAKALVYVGTIVGVAGPLGIIRIHDTRDWAQREAACHDFFAHRRSFFQDLCWNLFYRFEFLHPPKVTIEAAIVSDPFYRFLEGTWRLQQIPLGLLLYVWGGWSFVLWGICARVFVSTVGHWSVTYFCHNPGPGRWHVKGAGIQASNLRGLGLITYGECWHNNHHAFPESAKIGLEKGQPDPGWWIINALHNAGLVYEVRLPRESGKQSDLIDHKAL